MQGPIRGTLRDQLSKDIASCIVAITSPGSRSWLFERRVILTIVMVYIVILLFVCLIVIMDVLAPRTHTFLGPMALYLSISYNAAGSSQINGSKRD